MTKETFIVDKLNKASRLDRVLRDVLPHVGRKAINQLIQDKQVQVNGKTVWLNSWKVKKGDAIVVLRVPDALPESPQTFDDAWVIADDGDVIAINKPVGLLSQGRKYGTQSNLLDLATERFGKVTLFHRLDRDTSGVVLLTRGGAINRYLDTAFKAQTIRKLYVALVHTPNKLDDQGIINLNIDTHPSQKNHMRVVEKGGRSAITQYHIEVTGETHQRVHLMPRTGRTHQLRVHLAYYDAPILGDRIYSNDAEQYDRLFLHAHQITLPATDAFSERTFIAPIPAEFSF